MATSKTTGTTKSTAASKAAATGWTQVPPAPKVPNFWQGHGHTLVYVGGWAVYEGTFSAKADVPDTEPLFHSKTAREAKGWAEAHERSSKAPAKGGTAGTTKDSAAHRRAAKAGAAKDAPKPAAEAEGK